MLGSFTLGGSLATNVPLTVVLLSLLGALPALAQAGTVLLVLDEEGHRVVQLLKRPGQPLALGLAPGRYRVWREQGRQTSHAGPLHPPGGPAAFQPPSTLHRASLRPIRTPPPHASVSGGRYFLVQQLIRV